MISIFRTHFNSALDQWLKDSVLPMAERYNKNSFTNKLKWLYTHNPIQNVADRIRLIKPTSSNISIGWIRSFQRKTGILLTPLTNLMDYCSAGIWMKLTQGKLLWIYILNSSFSLYFMRTQKVEANPKSVESNHDNRNRQNHKQFMVSEIIWRRDHFQMFSAIVTISYNLMLLIREFECQLFTNDWFHPKKWAVT